MVLMSKRQHPPPHSPWMKKSAKGHPLVLHNDEENLIAQDRLQYLICTQSLQTFCFYFNYQHFLILTNNIMLLYHENL